MSESELGRYSEDVVKAWDEASWNFKVSCDAANDNTYVAKFFKDGRLKEWYASVDSIDGVGTKVQIYTSAFEWYVREFEEEKISDKELFQKSVDIWERMLHDLIAMNTDDLRQWEMAVSITNIIDINHLKWVRGKAFSDSMSVALWNVIKENDIMLTAGETAILWNPKQVQQILGAQNETFDEVLSVLTEKLWEGQVTSQVEQILKSHHQKVEVIFQGLEFNIGGTAKGITDGRNKLSPLKPWQVVVALQEKRKNGIIGPRSNGITAIRNSMTEFAWENWENMTFEEFLEVIGDEKASLVSNDIRMVCQWKKMWEVATGKSTVFNPFVSRTLLGGVDGDKQVKLSSIIHVTGNPWHKIASGVPWVGIDLDISDVPVPTIIEILQSVSGISDEDAIKGWNMWVPYALICDEDQVEEVIRLANEDWIQAQRIGTITEESSDKKGTIKGVWIGNSEIEIPLAA